MTRKPSGDRQPAATRVEAQRSAGSKTLWRAAIAAGVALAGALVLAVVLGKPGRYNVLLISLDTLRKDHMSTYGYARPTTPAIDALAADGLVFERGVAVSNWTLPTHASMLTGVLPPTHGAHFVTRDQPFVKHVEPAARMSDEGATLAEILGGAGYRTGAVLANWWWLGRPYGLDRGFEHYDHRRGTSPPVYRRASKITDEGIDWLSRSDGRPFFLMLNYMDPHIPYAAPAPYDRRFDERSSPPPSAKPWTFWIRAQRQVLRTGRALDRDLHRFMVDRYDGEIAYLDEHVGRLLNWLREADLYANTLIILTSNLGSHLIAALDEDKAIETVEEGVMEVVKAAFRPEFLNRLDETILFHRLARSHMSDIIQIQLTRLQSLLDDKKLTLEVTQEAIHWFPTSRSQPCQTPRRLSSF